MIEKIYKTFYDKLPDSLEQVLPCYEGCKIVTCLNPYYMVILNPKDYSLYEKFDYISSDGMGPLILHKLLRHPKSVRLSFDLSSMAGPVFRNMMEHGKSMYILGAKPDEVVNSVKTITQNFPGINIAGYHHGYLKENRDEIIKEVISSGAKICIIGMGAPMQDKMVVRLKELGFVGTAYTCGGFIHQTQNSMVSFPDWTNKFGLRWLYRIFTQKGMLKRLIQTYPKFVITYTWFHLFHFNKCNK